MPTPATPPTTFDLAAAATAYAGSANDMARDDRILLLLEMIAAQLQQIRLDQEALKTSFDTKVAAFAVALTQP